MAYYSKYTGKELEERLDRINDIPTLINKLFLDKEYLTELDVKCLIKEMIPTFYEGIPIDNKTIYWENGVLKSLGTGGGEGGGGCDCPELWEVKEVNGQQYLYSRLPIATQGGITMYANGGGINIPSIYAGIPVDETTITKREDGTLMVNPNIELGGASNWDELEGKPSWVTDSKPKYSYNEIEGAPDLSKYALNEDIEKLVTLNTDQIISGYKNFEKGLAINGLSITNTKDDIIYLDANLVIRGGLVIYADDTVDVPNLIDSLPKASYEVPGLAAFDSTYFVVDINGKVTLIPDNVGLNETELYSYLTSNRYATQEWVTSKNYATIGALNTLEDKIDSFLEGSDTDTIINKWKELEVFLNGLSESDNLANILSSKVGKDYVDGNFVTLGTAQSILGEKDFVGGLKVNGSPIYYDTEKKYWKFEGDLLVTGGVTMYGNDSEFIPSTIMDTIQTDGVTIRVNPITKNLEVIGNLNGATTLGGLSNVGTWADSVADVDRIMYQQAGSSNWVAKSLSSIGGGGGVSGDYLPLSGGTLTLPNRRGLIINRTDENKPVIAFYNSSTSDYNYLGFNGDTPIVMKGNGSNYPILHTDNYSQYALPLSGGTLNGALCFGSTKYIISHVTDSKDGRLDITNMIGTVGFGLYDDGRIQVYKKGYHDILHSGNYSSYALPLTGGTISNSVGIPLIINSTTTANALELRLTLNSANKAGFGWDYSNGSYVYESTSKSVLGLKTDGTPHLNGNTIWHSGNDGSGSGLDADLLDGQNGDWYQKNVIAFSRQDPVAYNQIDANVVIGGMLYNYGSYNYWKNAPTGMYYGHILTLKSSDMSLAGQLAWDINHNSTTDTTRYLWWRATDQGDWVEAKWHQIAFADSNVASATKLQTARTIWGQSFDGSGNVDGKILLTSWDNDGIGLRFQNNTKGVAYISMYAADGNAYLFGQNGNRFLINHNVYGDIFNVLGGNVGIGTTSPSYKLHVQGAGYFNEFVTVNGNVNCAALEIIGAVPYIDFHYNQSSADYTTRIVEYSSGVLTLEAPIVRTSSEFFANGKITTNGVFQMGNYIKLHSNNWTELWVNWGGAEAGGNLMLCGKNITFHCGNVAAYQVGMTLDASSNLLVYGGITMYSQRSLKNVIDERGLSLSELSTIKPTRYTWKDNRDNRLHIGGIADDIQQVLPEVVYKTGDNVLTMDYGNAAFAIASSLIKPVIDHEQRIAMLEQENRQLRQELERLKSA